MELLYLASTSPRRLELMRQIGLNPRVLPVSVDESALPNETPHSFVRRLAVEKAQAGFNSVPAADVWIVGGDTVVVADDRVLGKPRDKADFMRMLRLLSGHVHQVLSGIAVVHDGVVRSTVNTSQVWMRDLSDREMEAYWASGEPQGKAGRYAIQGRAARFIERIEGSYSGIMGLPLYELDQLLQEAGYHE